MKEYVDMFCESYDSARKLKEYIYSLSDNDDMNDILWDKIVFYSIVFTERAKWYFED